jgi:hypothetical protein
MALTTPLPQSQPRPPPDTPPFQFPPATTPSTNHPMTNGPGPSRVHTAATMGERQPLRCAPPQPPHHVLAAEPREASRSTVRPPPGGERRRRRERRRRQGRGEGTYLGGGGARQGAPLSSPTLRRDGPASTSTRAEGSEPQYCTPAAPPAARELFRRGTWRVREKPRDAGGDGRPCESRGQ